MGSGFWVLEGAGTRDWGRGNSALELEMELEPERGTGFRRRRVLAAGAGTHWSRDGADGIGLEPGTDGCQRGSRVG